MRALLVDPGPNFSVQDVADGWYAGLLECGVQVQRFNLGVAMTYHERAMQAAGMNSTGQDAANSACRDLRQACFDWWPDVVIVISSFFVNPATYAIPRSRGMKMVTICTESPYEDDNQIHLGHHADMLLINDPTNLDRFREVNPNTFYVPHAYNPAIHTRRPVQDQYRSDVCFVGTGYPSRIEFLEAVDWTGIDLAIAGNWAQLDPDSPLRRFLTIDDPRVCCDNSDETVELYSSCQASFNVYRTEAQHDALSEGWAMGPREVELAACGTFYLTQERGENRTVLPMVPTFTGPDDLGEKLRWYLARPGEREEIARKAREAIADRTFGRHAAELLARLG